MYRSEERLNNNLKILELLKVEAYKHPDLRFWQLLTIAQVIRYGNNIDHPVVKDGFYEESSETLNRVKGVLNDKI